MAARSDEKIRSRRGRRPPSIPFLWRLAALIFAMVAGTRTSLARVPVRLETFEDNSICLACHSSKSLKKKLADGRTLSLTVDRQALTNSVHGHRTCTECHDAITEIPHTTRTIERVNCSRCHYVGSLKGVPKTGKYAEYQESVHKRALDAGDQRAPTCQDCHGSHDVLAPKAPASHVNRVNVPKICGHCHLDEYSDYRDGIHGQLLAGGNPDVPVCTSCHGEHTIRSHKDPKSSVYATHVPETCSKCHASQGISDRYKIPRERYETYRESYHGIANEFGSRTVANCASCHGAHAILPSSDPRSSVNKRNLARTCRKCHHGATENFARGKVHVIVSKRENPLLYYVNLGFRILTIGTMTMLIGHIGLDLFRKWTVWRSRRV